MKLIFYFLFFSDRGKVGCKLELVEFGFPGKDAFHFYHVKSASQVWNNVPIELAVSISVRLEIYFNLIELAVF